MSNPRRLLRHAQDEPKFNTQLSEFKSLTEDKVKKIVLKYPNKYCELDPIPTLD